MVNNMLGIFESRFDYDTALEMTLNARELLDVIAPDTRNKIELSRLYLNLNINLDEVLTRASWWWLAGRSDHWHTMQCKEGSGWEGGGSRAFARTMLYMCALLVVMLCVCCPVVDSDRATDAGRQSVGSRH